MVGELTCDKCDGKCCKYVITEIDCPEDLEDFENIRWFVCHENVFVYVEQDGTWNLEFITPCKFLGKDNKCLIYDKRPAICREFSQESCPFHNEYKELFRFEKPEDVEEYVEKIFKKGLHVIPEDDEN